MNLIYPNYALIKSSGDVYPRKSILVFYSLTISLLVEDTSEQTSEQRRQHLRYYKQVSFGLLYLKMLLGFAVLVTDAKEQGTSLPKIKCHYKIFKRSNSLTYGVLISWALSLTSFALYIF
jgi:hypothetical protein